MLQTIKLKIFMFTVALMATLALSAQHSPGSWMYIPMAGEKYQKVADTPAKVYYLTGNSLYSYDKEYQETIYYTPGTKLSDSGVSDIIYNHESDYLMVIYNNSNIDLIYEDGHVVNLPEIKIANLTASKKINHVMFRNNRVYVATDFGIVIYDDINYQVVESGIYGQKVTKVMATDDDLLVVLNNGHIMASPLKDRHNSLDKFKMIGDYGILYIQQIDSTHFIYANASYIYFFTIDVPNKRVYRDDLISAPECKALLPYKEGFYAICNDGIILFDNKGKYISTTSLDASLKNQNIGLWSGLNSIWAADADGIANYDITGSDPTIKSDKFRVESSMMFNAGYCTPSPDGSAVYITCMGMSECHPAGDPNTSELPVICEKYEWATGRITPVHPYGVENFSNRLKKLQKELDTKLFYGGAGRTLIDPVDPDIIYQPNNFEGLLIIKNQDVIYKYDETNSALMSDYGCFCYDANFDNNGNLWVGYWRAVPASNDPSKSIYRILPAKAVEKLRKDPSTVTLQDWIYAKWPSNDVGKMDMKTVFSSRSNKMIYIQGNYDGAIVGYDTKGTTETSDDSSMLYSGFIDQDGTVSNPIYKSCIIEDKKGNIWIGTSQGIYVVTDIDQIANNNSGKLAVRRPKVARNDGTNFADYLLTTETVLNIAVDPSNRKWIATKNSGVYLVNEDGTEIIQQFTKDNSMLMSDCVYAVACDPNGNDVLFGTPDGLVVYSSTSSPAAEDLSEVYVYPNPVRPEYTGWITIQGLMDNSLVKIADMQGNVLWEGQSEGGMAIWDGCNRSGQRVRSGVYLVFASQNSNDSSNGAVAKIVVVN